MISLNCNRTLWFVLLFFLEDFSCFEHTILIQIKAEFLFEVICYSFDHIVKIYERQFFQINLIFMHKTIHNDEKKKKSDLFKNMVTSFKKRIRSK